jgi:hypothetical protein
MKRIRNIFILATALLSFAAMACGPHWSDPPALPSLPPPSDIRQFETRLPEQEMRGLRAAADFKVLHYPIQYTHSLDLRLTNRDSAPKTNVRVERITLDGFVTEFTPPPPATLWQRGSSVDYPSIALWTLPGSLRARVPLEVLVRYEDRFGKGIVVQFRWEVIIESSDPLTGEAPEPIDTK